MKKLLTLFLLGILCTGCVGEKFFWQPDTVHTGGYTYDSGHQTYVDAGISGDIGKTGITMDIFGFIVHDDGENHLGVGMSFEIPIGGK